jgi:hypothetical protein
MGRNGLFTGQLLNNLKFPGIAYLGEWPAETAQAAPPSALAPLPSPPPERERADNAKPETRLRTLGASVGTSLAAPYVIGTVYGTIAPFDYSFLELGLDVGFISGVSEATGYYSLYPFAHYAYYRPMTFGGWYAGAGVGMMMVRYSFPEEDFSDNFFGVDFTTGLIVLDRINISYTFRTNFDTGSNKLAVGYAYRFK